MGILPKAFTGKAKEVRKKEQKEKKTLKKVGRVVPRRGHTLYEVNMVEQTIEKATFEKQDYVAGEKAPTKKVVMKKNCVYISALNEKNLKKKVLKIYGVQL